MVLRQWNKKSRDPGCHLPPSPRRRDARFLSETCEPQPAPSLSIWAPCPSQAHGEARAQREPTPSARGAAPLAVSPGGRTRRPREGTGLTWASCGLLGRSLVVVPPRNRTPRGQGAVMPLPLETRVTRTVAGGPCISRGRLGAAGRWSCHHLPLLLLGLAGQLLLPISGGRRRRLLRLPPSLLRPLPLLCTPGVSPPLPGPPEKMLAAAGRHTGTRGPPSTARPATRPGPPGSRWHLPGSHQA